MISKTMNDGIKITQHLESFDVNQFPAVSHFHLILQHMQVQEETQYLVDSLPCPNLLLHQ